MKEPISRTSKQRKRKSERLLNRLIVSIVLLVVVTAIILININLPVEQTTSSEKQQQSDATEVKTKKDESNKTDEVEQVEQNESTAKPTNQPIEEQTTSPGIVSKPEQDEDSIVIETIVDTSWEPIGTKQTGYHESKYDGKSIDWHEKREAIAYATLFDVDDLIFWKIKNGGDEQRSIGIVSTFDEKHKYRVYLQWEDGKGWKPTKLEVLRTLDFEY
ncbi:YrrS family protein [Savagea faecisuis]|uniref:YrrS family protein n=1 Tax=Savagea faecisuis TaxID=1274803 RepID=A0ABW3H2G0_9BACL